MTRKIVFNALMTAIGIVCVSIALNSHVRAESSSATLEAQARQILQRSQFQGGLIVHLGCSDGRLTAALRANEGCMVHGLDRDSQHVTDAREYFSSRNLYPAVTADVLRGDRLPYVDNLANLVVIQDAGHGIPEEEILRVLAPGGVALLLNRQSDIEDRKWTKPVPAGIDEWTHQLHDATGNAVADDEIVGPPKHVQWIGSPSYLRHHDHMSGLSAMVSARGRLFYIIDLGPRWSVQMPPQWTLIARDAFNGVVLWQRPISKWHPHLWPLKKGPSQIMRRLVAEDNRVYVTLGVGEPVTVLDAATGEVVDRFEETEGAEEMILDRGTLFVLADPQRDAYSSISRESVESIRGAGRDWNWDERPRRLVAVDVDSGKVLWIKESRVVPVSLAAADRRVYFHDGNRIVCWDAADGRDIWNSKPIARWKPMHVLFGASLIVYEDVILFAGGEKMDPLKGGKDTMTALSAKTGETLWTAPHPPSGYASAEDLLVVDGLVWCGETTSRRDSGVFTGRDLHTGEVKREFPPDDWQPHMSHHRCYRAKAAGNYILTSRTGIEFVDVRQQHWTSHHWVRGSCNHGIVPCNGLVYAPPHSCACYLLAKLNGLNALASGARAEMPKFRKEDRLQRGPAFDLALDSAPSAADSSWPTYRGDAARSGSTKSNVPAELKQAWSVGLGGKLSSVVVAGGKAFVAAIDKHTVHAIDIRSGTKVWKFTVGGRVDSPPTVWKDRVIFGSADGSVYCLRADDGALAWRFQAAPADQRLMAQEQLESVWPVHGSVLVHNDVVYCVAGRSMWLDGGMRLLRLDAKTGQAISETVLDDKYPGSGENLQQDLQWPNLPVALPDVLSCDGRHVYMRSQPFDLEGKRTDIVTPRNYSEQRGETAHLFSPTGFLDDSWWHRTYWLYGRSFISGAGGWYLAGYQAPAGRILVVDDSFIYGFGNAPLRFTGTPNAYHLFACRKEPKLINPNPKAPPRRRGASIYGEVVPTRLDYEWSESIPLLARAMVATKNTLFVAGPPVQADETDVYQRYGEKEIQAAMAEHVAAFAGRKGAILMAVSKADGSRQAAYRMNEAPVFDGMVAAADRLFVSTMDGNVVCLSPKGGSPLEPAPDAKPTDPPTASPTAAPFTETQSHPDFQKLAHVRIATSDLGYRIEAARTETGLAVKKLKQPISAKTVFRVRIRPRPGAAPDTPGNAFLAFGDGPADDQLVKCGFRISGQHMYVVQGLLAKGTSRSVPVSVKANQIVDLTVVVDPANQKVTATMNGQSVEADLSRELSAITWLGYCISSVDADFSRVDIENE